MLNFDFLEKGLGIVSAPYFVYDFSRKMLFISYSVKGALSGLKQFLTTESPLKMKKNDFYVA